MSLAIRIRCYAELNDHLALVDRQRELAVSLAAPATVADMLAALGLPAAEVDLVLVGGASVGLDHALADGDRVAVYPVFEAFDVASLARLPARPLRRPRFLVDRALAELAEALCRRGFDAVPAPAGAAGEVVARARAEQRIVLTGSRELLACPGMTHGLLVRAAGATAQVEEVLARLDLPREQAS